MNDNATIKAIAIHKTGNKLKNEGVICSEKLFQLDDTMNALFKHYFLSAFKNGEYYHFYHENDLRLNKIFNAAASIFDDNAALLDESVNIAQHLYNQSEHDKIKGGELFIVYMEDCFVDGETVDAVGIFKAETKENFIQISLEGDNYQAKAASGININKPEKGCIIYNSSKEKGFVVSVSDKSTSGFDAQYWLDYFLQIRQRDDTFFQTQNIIKMCKDFVTEKMPEEFELSKADQADLLNKSAKYFKEKESFDIKEFTEEVLEDKNAIQSFRNYKNNFEDEHEIKLENTFEISDTAVKKQARSFKSVIKLDTNVHIYVHGQHDLLLNRCLSALAMFQNCVLSDVYVSLAFFFKK